jgi:chemotaxis protein MotA
MLYEVFVFVQRAGISALENDVDTPQKSPIFARYPEFLHGRETREFICDSLRMLVIGATAPHELDRLMDLDIDVQRRGRHEPGLPGVIRMRVHILFGKGRMSDRDVSPNATKPWCR